MHGLSTTESSLLFAKGDLAGAMKDAEKACSLGYQDGCKAYETYKHSFQRRRVGSIGP